MHKNDKNNIRKRDGKVRKALGNMSALMSEKGLLFLGRNKLKKLINFGDNTSITTATSTATSHWIEIPSLMSQSVVQQSPDMFRLLLFYFILTHFLCICLNSIFSSLFPSHNEKYLEPLKYPLSEGI